MESGRPPQSTSLPKDAAALVGAGLQRALANCIALEFRVRSASWVEPIEGWGAALPQFALELGRIGDALGRRVAVLGLTAPPNLSELNSVSAVSAAWSENDWRRRRLALADALIRVSEDCRTLIAILRNAGEEASVGVLASLLSRCEEISWSLQRSGATDA